MRTTIRPERDGDEAAIDAVTRAAFAGAPHAGGNEAEIVASLRAAGALALSFVAEEAGVVVGHVAISPVGLASREGGWFGLGPLSVHPDRQRRGIGARLVERALDALRDRGARGCVLVGDPAYYARFGFRSGTRLSVPGVPAEFVQALAFAGPPPSGTIGYHAAFGLEP